MKLKKKKKKNGHEKVLQILSKTMFILFLNI